MSGSALEALSALQRDLLTARASADLLPAPGSQPRHHTLAVLRAALPAHAAAAAREAQRFALVLGTGGLADAASARAVCASLGGAAERLVALVQTIADDVERAGAGGGAEGGADGGAGAPAAPTALRVLCPGRALLRETRGAARNVLGSLSALVEAGSAAEALRQAASVGTMCDAVARLPTTPVAAVRRALMTTARLVRTSALEIKAENAAVASPGGAESAGAGAEAAELPALVRGGLAALRCTQRLVELALANVEAAVTAASAEPPPPAAAAAAAAAAPAAMPADLDAVADAAGALHAAVIDLAFVVNGGADGDDGDDLDEEDEGEEDEDEDEGEGKVAGAVAAAGDSGGGGGDGSELAEAVAAMASAADSLVAALRGSCAPAPADAAALGEALAAVRAAVGALR
jgi:hypothetical protein